jgi:hypothetical protein
MPMVRGGPSPRMPRVDHSGQINRQLALRFSAVCAVK